DIERLDQVLQRPAIAAYPHEIVVHRRAAAQVVPSIPPVAHEHVHFRSAYFCDPCAAVVDQVFIDGTRHIPEGCSLPEFAVKTECAARRPRMARVSCVMLSGQKNHEAIPGNNGSASVFTWKTPNRGGKKIRMVIIVVVELLNNLAFRIVHCDIEFRTKKRG